MSLLTATLVFTDGLTLRCAVYRVLGATDGDTVDLKNDFHRIVAARALPLSSGKADLGLDVTVNGTILTLVGPSLSGDAVYVIATGGAAS